jgi:LacI family transcriptional regulator, galactose operon repressor
LNETGRRPGKPPTIRDVAELASVAPATVSNVLTGRRPVADDRKQRVLAAVAQLGYRPNHLAASLRRQETRTIGIVIPDLTNPFFAALVHRIEELAAESNYQILLMSSNEDTGQEAHRVEVLLARQTDGLIIAPARDDLSAFAKSAADLPPTVLVDRGFGLPGFDTVAADNLEAAKRGCQHLLSLGHRDIALVVSDTALANIADRVAGYRAALGEAGLAERARVVMGGFTVDGCRGAIEQELRRADRPTAIFSAAYIATLGAIKAIRALDLEFPDDVSLLSFDDTDWMTALRPYVSAVAQPVDEMAAESWRLLKHRLTGAGAEIARIRLPCSLQVRESTRPPSATKQKRRIGST